MGVIIYSFNLNISSQMAYDMLECYSYVTELHAYDFEIKDFVIKDGCYLCQTLYFARNEETHREWSVDFC